MSLKCGTWATGIRLLFKLEMEWQGLEGIVQKFLLMTHRWETYLVTDCFLETLFRPRWKAPLPTLLRAAAFPSFITLFEKSLAW